MSLQLEHLQVELQEHVSEGHVLLEHVSEGQKFWAKWDFKNSRTPTLNFGKERHPYR